MMSSVISLPWSHTTNNVVQSDDTKQVFLERGAIFLLFLVDAGVEEGARRGIGVNTVRRSASRITTTS